MIYEIIFTLGHNDDEEAMYRGCRGDVLIKDDSGLYYSTYYTIPAAIVAVLTSRMVCYMCNDTVILHELTKENILKSIKELHDLQFYKSWKPLTEQQVIDFYYPKDDWISYYVEVDDYK